MQNQSHASRPLDPASFRLHHAVQPRYRLIFLFAIVILALTTLSCGIYNRVLSSGSDFIRERDSTSEATSQAQTDSEEAPVFPADEGDQSSDRSPTEPIIVPTPAPLGESVALTIPDTNDWSFSGVQAQFDPNMGGLQVYGEMTNHTGATQQLVNITGTASDEQGQIITTEGNVFGFSPFILIPSDGRVPFSLTAIDIQSAAIVELVIETERSETVLRQDFEISDVKEREGELGYCLNGTIKDQGESLQDSLQIVAILYNDQDNVVNFFDNYLFPNNFADSQSQEFEICVDPLNQEVARYELRAWGQ